MPRLLVLLTLLTLSAQACSDSDDDGDRRADIDSNLGTIEVAVKEDSPGLKRGDRLLDAAVGVDGVLYLALKSENGQHRLLSLRTGRDPRVLADETTVPGFAPTALAVDSRFRSVYVASGNEVLRFQDQHGAEGTERLLVTRGPSPGPPQPQGGSPPPSALIGPPRYMAFDGRTHTLYIADACRIVRYGTGRSLEVSDVAEVAGGPGADCLTKPARITGLAVDQRTGDVYVGRGDELMRVGADGKLSAVSARQDQEGAVTKAVVGLNEGLSLAVNGVGDVLVATRTVVLRVGTDGILGIVRGEEESPNGSRSGPASNELRLWDENWIGLDGAGNLYVATRTVPNELGDAPVQIRKVIAGAL